MGKTALQGTGLSSVYLLSVNNDSASPNWILPFLMNSCVHEQDYQGTSVWKP